MLMVDYDGIRAGGVWFARDRFDRAWQRFLSGEPTTRDALTALLAAADDHPHQLRRGHRRVDAWAPAAVKRGLRTDAGHEGTGSVGTLALDEPETATVV
jgi:hypothetical protein